jgi:predicted GH43/DUF377 family glycosyl hydrolase
MYTVHRSKYNPLLQPSVERSWESIATLNGCPIRKGNEIHMVYRAMGKPDLVFSPRVDNSIIAKTVSKDGNNFGPTSQLVVPAEDFDKYGCEDPRVTFFEGKYYIFYTALSVIPFQASGIKVAVAVSEDLETITERHLVTPFNAKAMTLFPERINGKVTAIFSIHTDQPPANMVIVQAEKIEDFWNQDFWDAWYVDYKDNIIVLERNDQDHCEVGAPPVLTDAGWLLIYSHTQHYFDESKRLFGIEAILLDRNNPFKVIGRTNSPIIVPEASYEIYGMVKNITFPSGAILHDDGKLDIYYGAADTICARASVSVRDLISSMQGEYRSFMARSFDNPLLLPIPENNFEGRAVFNPASIEIDGVIYILYRAMSMDNTSTVGLAISHDGRKITERLDYPIYVPRADFEEKRVLPDGNSGCEDPRITRVGDTLYILYTAYNGVTPPAVAVSHISVEDFLKRRFENWSKPRLLSPSMVDDKDACIVPGKFPHGHLVFHRIGNQICADFLEDIKDEAHMLNRCIEILRPRYGMWDEKKVGIAGPPIKTDAGWLLFYHGVSANGIYRVGVALLDKDDPTYVISRLSDPIFEPQEKYELEGQIPNVVFPCGAVVRDDTIYMYYGGGDSVVGLATCSLSKLLSVLLPKELKED